jgi:hypothetical protein
MCNWSPSKRMPSMLPAMCTARDGDVAFWAEADAAHTPPTSAAINASQLPARVTGPPIAAIATCSYSAFAEPRSRCRRHQIHPAQTLIVSACNLDLQRVAVCSIKSKHRDLI